MPQEKQWALYAQSSSGAKIPQRSQCADCFALWKAGFAYMEWDAMVQLASESTQFAECLAKAREMHSKGESMKEDKQSVAVHTLIGLHVDRTYTVISEREMRRHASLARIKKSSLGKLPCLQVPHEDCSGQQETVYVFQNEAEPFRKATLRVACSSDLSDVRMSPGTALWGEQAQRYHSHAATTTASETKALELVQKDLQGHLNLYTWEAFKEEFLAPRQAGESEEQQVSVTSNSVVEADLQLVGVAAAATPGAGDMFSTPEDKKGNKQQQQQQQSKLRKMSSASSLKAGSSEPGTASPSGILAPEIGKDEMSSALQGATEASEVPDDDVDSGWWVHRCGNT